MKNRAGLLVLALAVLAMVPALAAANVTTGIVTLADLLQPGASILAGDKLFFDFDEYHAIATGGATAVDAATVIVAPIQLGGEWGLHFQSANFFASTNQTQDTCFQFKVLVTEPNWLISDNTLTMTAAAVGTGRASIAENVLAVNNDLLAQNLTFVFPTVGLTVNHKEFPYPVTEIRVAKDIAVVGGTNGTAFISDFTQTFSQIPEPATLSLLAFGGLAFLIRRRRA
jgi:hypothetical protein